MKNFVFIYIGCLLISSCYEDKSISTLNDVEQIIPAKFILKSAVNFTVANDVVFLDKEKFSGFIYDLASNKKDTTLLEGYINGKLNGVCKKWFPNRQLMEVRLYDNGKKHGKQVAYWANGNKRFEFIAKNDAYEGEMREWTFDGKLFHLANFVNGQEEGTQKMWYDNGKIRANYVIRQGKRYGLLGTKNCKNVSDSIFVVK
jgi:antitoxin component YwqK of YwqJK toxin-antitoxin module